MGDIAFVRNRGRAIARTAYASGFRPRIPKSLRKVCPEIAALIDEMWLNDFRARPVMKDVVVRLEACVSVEGVVNEDHNLNDELNPYDNSTKASPEHRFDCFDDYEREFEKILRQKEGDRHEIAKLKAALLAGTSIMECDDDDVGILGGMFICKCSSILTCWRYISQTHTITAPTHTQSIPTRSAVSSGRVHSEPSTR